MSNINIVLFEPEIPQNTGNIARTCASTDSTLHIIKPMGFEIDDSKLKRAGLDYWHDLDIRYYDSLDDFYNKNKNITIYYFTKKAKTSFTDVKYNKNVYLMFGKESIGLPEELIKKNLDTSLRIPMKEGLRSLNLSNTVAIAVYEVLKQNDYFDLKISNNYFED